MFEDTDPRVVYELHAFPVLYQGFKSDVGTLYRNNWKLFLEKDHYHDSHFAFFINDTTRMTARITGLDIMRQRSIHNPIVIQDVMPAPSRQYHSDYIPRMMTMQPRAHLPGSMTFVESFTLHQLLEPEDAAPSLIVDPKDVSTLLADIIAKQRPQQAELRKKMQSIGTPRTTARIISFTEHKECISQ